MSDPIRAHDRLLARYQDAWGFLAASLPRDRGLSNPHFIRPPETYFECPTRLMIVGQETNGWSASDDGCFGEPLGDNPARRLMDVYADFELGRRRKRSPFWQAAHCLYEALNPGHPRGAFLWSNLVKMDQCGHRPRPEYENLVAGLELLRFEIEVLRPHVVVFFTGPRYRERLERTFPDAGREIVDHPLLFRITLPPAVSVVAWETYHPNYLRRDKARWGLLDRIAALTEPLVERRDEDEASLA